MIYDILGEIRRGSIAAKFVAVFASAVQSANFWTDSLKFLAQFLHLFPLNKTKLTRAQCCSENNTNGNLRAVLLNPSNTFNNKLPNNFDERNENKSGGITFLLFLMVKFLSHEKL